MGRLVGPVLAAGTFRSREQPTLGVDGLELRPWTAGDAGSLAAAYADQAIGFWHHRTMDVHEAAAWINDTSARWRDETDAEWAVVRDAGLAGRIALRGVQLRTGQAEVSYWTVPAARGAGVARCALGRLAGWALNEVGFHRLVVEHSSRNVASCRVAEAAGFAHEATLRRCHLHADGWHDVHLHTRFADA